MQDCSDPYFFFSRQFAISLAGLEDPLAEFL